MVLLGIDRGAGSDLVERTEQDGCGDLRQPVVELACCFVRCDTGL